MKKKVEQDERPTRLAPVELSQRLDTIRAKLSGLSLDGSLEPSHNLINKYAQMYEEDTLRHLPWEQLTSRIHAQGVKQDAGIRVVTSDAAGVLKVRQNEMNLTVQLGLR